MQLESAVLMHSEWATWVARWRSAGLIDADTAERIRAFEQAQGTQQRMRWPIVIALAFGGLMVGGGIVLFVAANWDALAPATRFALVLVMVGGLHAGGAFAAERFPAMSVTLHAIGTLALGAGIALSGQIFNLDEHWPGGIMMWALGAGLAAWLLRDQPQVALVAILVPAWLVGEWTVALGHRSFNDFGFRVVAGGCVALALTYFTAITHDRRTPARKALLWTGGLTFPPLAIALAFAAADRWRTGELPPPLTLTLGLTAAVGIPLGLAIALRGKDASKNGAAIAWILVLFALAGYDTDVLPYVWWATGAVGLVAWGISEARTERINMGAAVFAATVLAFYFSQVMDKLGRSASLVGLGLLFLGGGWALERLRRRLVVEARGDQ
jgi:uncharacterized membrane protein